MIKFLSDWRTAGAIADLDTPNQSYVRLAALYREMGIKNHMFHLALHDRALRGVDPHSLELTLDQQLRIAHECLINPWYFFREVIKAPAESGGDATQFLANRGNIALYWCFFNHITTILIQIRQTGKSLSVDSLMVLLLNIMVKGTEINLLTKDDTLRSRNIERLKALDMTLPAYLRQRNKTDVNNTEEITVNSRGNRYRAHLPQKSPKMANNVGRGLSAPIFHVDEGPFQPNIKIALEAALPAGVAARERAEAAGQPWGTLFTTTAGKRDDRDGSFMYQFVSESAEWTERFFDCADPTELEAMVRRHSRTSSDGKAPGGVSNKKGNYRVNITLNHRQLGKDDAWLAKAMEESVASGENADRDFGNVWTSGNASHPLHVKVLENIRAGVRPEDHTTISRIGGYITKWYVPEATREAYMHGGTKFIMSMDTSDASGGDDISLVLTDVSTGETVAAGNYNETNLLVLAEWIAREWIGTYENITVCIERKSSGVAILDALLLLLPSMGIDPFKRLFNRIVNESDDHPTEYKEVQVPFGRRSNDIYVRFKKAFGFATAGTGVTSRSDLFSVTLQEAAKRIGHKVRDRMTVNQIAGLEQRNGRIDHALGEHDDMVIAWLLNAWMLMSAKNLSFYGIYHKEILNKLAPPRDMSPQEAYDAAEQQALKQEMHKVIEQLKETSDEFVTQKLERRLAYLDGRISYEDHEKISIEELINSVREEKRKRRSFANSHNNQLNLNTGYGGAYGSNFATSNYTGKYGASAANQRANIRQQHANLYQTPVNPFRVF